MREGELEERPTDGGKQGTTLKKQTKDKVAGSTTKANRSDKVTVSGAPRVKPELALPVITEDVEHSILEDLRNRVQLSSMTLPSWHANCNYIATGSSDKTVRLWDVQSEECVRIFIGHRSSVLCLAMSPDGRYMASGDEDGKIMMWDLSSGRCVSPMVGHSSCIWSLSSRDNLGCC
ncbi:Transcription initiation factor TFIID subunit 5 [Striga hermonthica]|uniref:Transcription initiation factor TFIID subunit 5 n=1 Tax=Striga hermonthica TaxID=68872 RepID=A0A9N7P2C2_STRHE|nr:Transcription initiation factor TFIID subunit 5 [Striga hermonthica]